MSFYSPLLSPGIKLEYIVKKIIEKLMTVFLGKTLAEQKDKLLTMIVHYIRTETRVKRLMCFKKITDGHIKEEKNGRAKEGINERTIKKILDQILIKLADDFPTDGSSQEYQETLHLFIELLLCLYPGINNLVLNLGLESKVDYYKEKMTLLYTMLFSCAKGIDERDFEEVMECVGEGKEIFEEGEKGDSSGVLLDNTFECGMISPCFENKM